jgi:hypothetical protein
MVTMKIIASTILLFLLGAMGISLFHMSMDMSGGMSNCLFQAQAEVICPMNLADHIGAWKSTFLAVAPTIMLLLAVAGVVALVTSFAPHLLAAKHRLKPILHRQLGERTYTFSYRPLQELFSNGILHPKLF